MTLKEIKYRAVVAAVRRFRGDKPKAAKHLGVSLKTIYNILNDVQNTHLPSQTVRKR